MPPKTKPVAYAADVISPDVKTLPDIPPVYLLDRAQWPEFKRALNECGLIWNFNHWMTTILFRGAEYKRLLLKDNGLDKYFPQEERKIE